MAEAGFDITQALACGVCGEQLTGDGDPSFPAVGQLTARGWVQWYWIEFVEDLRTSAFELIHPRCFADDHGVDALIEVVHQADLIRREGVAPVTIQDRRRSPLARRPIEST